MPINPYIRGGNNIAIADGGTNADTAAEARTNLDVLDEIAHDLLDHDGLTGVGDMTIAAHLLIDHSAMPHGFLNIGTTTLANSSGDLAAGLIGATELFYDASTGALVNTVTAAGNHIVATGAVAAGAVVIRSQNTSTDAASEAHLQVLGDTGVGSLFARSSNHVDPNSITLDAANGRLIIGTSTAHDIAIRTAGAARWTVAQATGHLLTAAINTNIGSTTTAEKPDIIYAASNVLVGTAIESSLNSTTGAGTQLYASGTVQAIREDAGTTDQVSSFVTYRKSTGTPGADFGSDILTLLEGVDVAGANTAGVIRTQWDGNPATPGFASKMSFWVHKPGAGAGSGATHVLTMYGSDGRSEFNGGVEIGSAVVGTAADGDIVAGDGTRELFWDASAGQLFIRGDDSATDESFGAQIYGNNGAGGFALRMRVAQTSGTGQCNWFAQHSRGTLASPLASVAGDTVLRMAANIQISSGIGNWQSCGYMAIQADGTVSGTSSPGRFTFFLVPNGSTGGPAHTERVRFNEAGGVLMGDVANLTATAAEGDLVVGDGVSEMFYDASTGILNVNSVLAATNIADGGLAVSNSTLTTPAIGLGTRIVYNIQTTTQIRAAGKMEVRWSTVTDATRTSDYTFLLRQSGSEVTPLTLRGADLGARLTGGLEVGASAGTITGAGDIVAGDGTRSMEWDASVGTLTVATTANERANIFVTSPSGTTSRSRLALIIDSDINEGGTFQAYSSAWTSISTFDIADSLFVGSTSGLAGGISIVTNAAAPIRFGTGASNLRWIIDGSNGNLIATGAKSILTDGASALTIDTGGSAALNLGTTSASVVNVGRSGQGVAMPGFLNIGSPTPTASANGGLVVGVGLNYLDMNSFSPGLLRLSTESGTETTSAGGIIICANSTGTPAIGYGTRILMEAQSATNVLRAQASITSAWTDATNTSEDGEFILAVMTGGSSPAPSVAGTIAGRWNTARLLVGLEGAAFGVLGVDSATNTVAGAGINVIGGAGQTTGDGGAILIDGGSSPSGTAGVISIGATNTAALNLGRSAGTIAVNIDTTTASHFTLTGTADLTLSNTAGRIFLTSGMAQGDAVRINASDAAGGIDIDSGTAGTSSTTSGSHIFRASAASATAIQIDASGAAGGVAITAGTGGIAIGAGLDIMTVSLGTGGTGAKTVIIGGLDSTSATTIQSGTGATTITAGGIFDVNATGAVTIDATNTTASNFTSANTTAATNTTLTVLCDNTGATSGDATLVLNATSSNGASIINIGNSGGTIGLYGVTAVARSSAYTPTNVSTDRAYDANATSINELADVVGTLIADLQALGAIG